MDLALFIKDLSKIDTEDILSDWKWLLDNQKKVILVSSIGDIFLQGNDSAVYWLDIGMSELTCVADSLIEFHNALTNEENIDNWFLPQLINQFITEGKILEENQVYSFKILPILGGDFSPENFEATDISVHFSVFGQIHKQIWDLRDETKIGNATFK